MAINWRDIQEQAEAFAHRYADAKDEDRDAKPFWKDLLELYGVDPRQIGAFEERVRIHGRPGVARIDYFAPRKFIIEHKSRGKDLDAAYRQAMDYFDALPKSERPRHIIVSDFARFRVYDLEAPEDNRLSEFTLEELWRHVRLFEFFDNEDVRVYKPEEPIDVKAVRAIGTLHDALRSSNYDPRYLSPLLTRLVFLFFADDTGIFERDSIRQYLEEHTLADGSDIGGKLSEMFQVLDTPEDKRQTTLHSVLANLPYVNGGLFAAPLPVVFASRHVRETILACAAFDWSRVSPAIFGSMFQSVMNEKERHDLGAHYTSETNILKVINGLFLQDLRAELDAAKTSREKLLALQDKLAHITLLDPACGCGNFLVVAYRELRAIENEIIARLYKGGSAKVESGHMVLPMEVDIKKLSKMSVERMYGIEIDSFPAEVAKLSLWLVDHTMNRELGALFGKPLRKLPLTEAPHIVQGNALRLDWESVVPKEKLSYILGNPPFVGSKVMSDEQRAEIAELFDGVKGAGVLDYVSGWYVKAARYIKDTHIPVAFVSTNSITQGEQIGILWKELVENHGVHIRFAHRTFKWSNEATGKAAVYCVIVGFGLQAAEHPKLYEYDDIKGEPREVSAKNINPYLVDASDVFIESRSKPICDVPEIRFGNQPIDDGLLTDFSTETKSQFLREEPLAEKYFKPFLGADEFLNGGERWCLWLKDAEPADLRGMPALMRRIEAVRTFRESSKRKETNELASTPTLFAFVSQPTSDYILIPRVSSENREYVPMSLFSPNNIAGDTCVIIPHAHTYHLGVLQSAMHMTWIRAVCGRLESRYRYSNRIVYNNFPWPDPTDEQKRDVEVAAQVVLDARAAHAGATLADLYDPLTMPKDLLDAHHHLDRAVDACYGKRKFTSEPERLEFLFGRYKELTQKVI